MNHRDRMLAAIRGKPTDQIPWAPRMDLWQIAQSSRGTLPERFQGMNTVEIAVELDVACHCVQGDFTQPGGGDPSLVGIGQGNHKDFAYRVELNDFPVEFDHATGDSKTRIKTPAGDITTHIFRSLEMARDGISLPYYKSYAIESVRDFEAIAQIFEHLEVIPTPENFDAYKNRLGEQGIAVARGPTGASPLHLMLRDLMAMDQFFYLWHDEQNAMQELSERMTPFYHRVLEVLSESDAEIVFWGANYDQDLTWPPFFEAEIVPWLKTASDKLHSVNKMLLTHTDGENKGILRYYESCGFDIAESVCTQPMTLCSLNEIRQGVGPKATVWGGIPSVTLLDDSMNDKDFNDYMDALFASLGTGERLILGVSDNVPPDANLDRLEDIKRRVEAFGPVNPLS